MWTVPLRFIQVCDEDIPSPPYNHADALTSVYLHTGGRGAWIGRLRVHPASHTVLAEDATGRTWTLTQPSTVSDGNSEMHVNAMLQRYVYEEYHQEAQDHLLWSRKCVNGNYMSSPELHGSDNECD